MRASDLGRAEEMLGQAEGIGDVQRFGDRLDVMASDTKAAERMTRAALAAAGIEVKEIRVAAPTLENTFVSVLREMGGEMKAPAFPDAAKVPPARA